MLAFWLSCATPPPPLPPDPAPPEPPAAAGVVLLLVVDQFPAWVLDGPVRKQLHDGLGRLLGKQGRQGTGRYSHVSTYTCTGHATLATGASPAVHGIVNNRWLVRPADEKPTDCLEAETGLLAPTLADAVRGAGGSAVALSLKERAALPLGGPAGSAWLDCVEGACAMRAAPGPLADALAGLDTSPYLRREWATPPPERTVEWRGVADLQPWEAPLDDGKDPPVFPHTGGTAAPGAGDLLVDAALRAVEALRLGQGPHRDLLTVSFSQIDFIGHETTPKSWEYLDALVALDGSVGRLLDALTARGYPVTAILTADHGAVEVPTGWLDVAAVETAVDAAATDCGGGEARYQQPFVYWSKAVDGACAIAKARGALTALRDGENALVADIVSVASPSGPFATAVRDTAMVARSGDAVVVLAEGAVLFAGQTDRRGTTHGTPHRYDTDVPFAAWGAGVTPGRVRDAFDQRRIAPTVAQLLGVPAPTAATLPPVPLVGSER